VGGKTGVDIPEGVAVESWNNKTIDGAAADATYYAEGSVTGLENLATDEEKAIATAFARNIAPEKTVFTATSTGEVIGSIAGKLDENGNVTETRDKAKPLFITYTEEQQPNPSAGIMSRGADIITAVSMDDGATWKRFNVSHMARRSSFKLGNGNKYPGNCRGPRQKIVDDMIMVIWTSAYARGGKPSFAIKTDDDYPHDDAYAVNDVWGVRGKQGSENGYPGDGVGAGHQGRMQGLWYLGDKFRPGKTGQNKDIESDQN